MIRWTPFLDKLLERSWNQGTSIKRIALETGASQSSIKERRRHLGLPTRAEGRHKILKVLLTEEEHQRVGTRACAKGCSSAEYVRSLIRRDAF